jgi:hypothetical protein
MPDADSVDDVNSFAQTVCPDIWTRYCEQAHTITNEYGPEGLSKEKAGKYLLSVRRLELTQRWEVNLKTEGKGAGYMNALWELKDLENEMANRFVDALKSGALVMQGYDPKLEKERVAAPVLITAKTVLQALDANSEGIIELKDGSKLFDTRLVRAEATAPEVMSPAAALREPQRAPDLSNGETTAAVPQKSDVDAMIRDELLALYDNALAAKEPAPPNAKDAGRIVAAILRDRGNSKVSANRVQGVAEGKEYKPLRRGVGQHRMSEDGKAAAKKRLAELKAAADRSS